MSRLSPAFCPGNITGTESSGFLICRSFALTFSEQLAHFELVVSTADKNQSGRRNLTPDQLRLIRGRIYSRTKQKLGGQVPIQGVDQNEPPLSTADKLAEQFKVSPATIERDGQLAEAVEVLGSTEAI